MSNGYDLLKVAATLLVVFGHITILYQGGSFGYLPANDALTILTSVIYLFHMPLFVALSGVIYELGRNKGKYLRFLPFLKNKLSRIILPFLIVGILFLAPTLVALGMTHESVFDCIMSVLTGGNCIKHLWFLPALFWIFSIVWVLDYFKVNIYLRSIGTIALAVVCSIYRFDLHYFCIGAAVQYLPYFILGTWLFKLQRFSCKVLVILMGGGIAVAAGQMATDITIFDNIFRILLPCSIVSVLVLLSLVVWKIPFLQRSRSLYVVLKNSFAIYLFHVMIIYAMYTYIGSHLPMVLMVPLTFVVAVFGGIVIARLLRLAKLQFVIGEK